MPVHENKFGTSQNVGYIRAVVRNGYNDSVSALYAAGELRDIA
jgi:hypothetical protein